MAGKGWKRKQIPEWPGGLPWWVLVPQNWVVRVDSDQGLGKEGQTAAQTRGHSGPKLLSWWVFFHKAILIAMSKYWI